MDHLSLLPYINIPSVLSKPILLVISGPTAVGKTELTVDLAKKLSTSVISADSRQFYKEMSVGTARPEENELSDVPHYFLGHLAVTDYYSVSRFEQDVLSLLPCLFKKNPVVVMTGGSGLYIDAVCKGIDDLPDPDPILREKVTRLYETEGIQALRLQLKHLDPVYYEQADLANHKRLIRALEVCIQTGKPFSEHLKNQRKERDFDIIKYCLTRPRSVLFSRIDQRVDKMMGNGLLEEAQNLLPYRKLNALNTVGYKELFEYLDGNDTLENAVRQIKTHTRRYAKRQMTWFRRGGDYREIELKTESDA